jgi:signal transduction histidine kinase
MSPEYLISTRLQRGLRRSIERVASLGEALAKTPNEMGFPPAIGFRVIVHGREKELRTRLSHEVYRIGREAIINAFRHSRATLIEAEIEYRRTALRIIVRDNGCGINPQELHWGRNGCYGLLRIREQADKIGAQLLLRSRLAGGTELELIVPGEVAFQSSRPRGSLFTAIFI